MSSLRKKIRLAFGGKRSEVVENVRFSEVESYIARWRDSGEASRDYSLLIRSYEEFVGQLDEVRRELDVLRESGEKRFTRITGGILKGIGSMDESDLSSFKQFYDDAAQAIQSLMKLPGVIQRRTLSYENGRETIDALNSLFKSFRNLRKVSSEVLAENSVLKHHRSALKKHKELEDAFNRMRDLQIEIELVEKENEERRRRLEDATARLQAGQSEIDGKEIVEAERRVASVDRRIRQISSDLTLNLRRGRRPISKILHSEDRRLFEFFKRFSKYPLESINERFWEMIAVLEKRNASLGGKERGEIDDFVSFCRNKLQDMIGEYEEARAEKKESEQRLNEISSRRKELLGNLELEKENAQNDFASASKRLDEMVGEKDTLEIDIEKNARMLERMLSKISSNRVKIEFD